MIPIFPEDEFPDRQVLGKSPRCFLRVLRVAAKCACKVNDLRRACPQDSELL
jgi:hypothetical protein